jgi:hypothetical protein
LSLRVMLYFCEKKVCPKGAFAFCTVFIAEIFLSAASWTFRDCIPFLRKCTRLWSVWLITWVLLRNVVLLKRLLEACVVVQEQSIACARVRPCFHIPPNSHFNKFLERFLVAGYGSYDLEGVAVP